MAALDDDDRAKAASESLGRSERYAVILPLLKAKTPQQPTERLRVTMARSCYPDRVRAQLPWSQPFGARQTHVFAERVKQADTRLERHNGGHAIDGEAARYRVGCACCQRDCLGNRER